MVPKTTVPKLFALLVGIDNYNAPITPLGGCVNDVTKLAQYLKNETNDFEPLIKTLTDEEATKGNIVLQFEKHLSKATKEDTVLFYYSGHGTQEDADEVFWRGESDKKLETIVCFDSVYKSNGITRINLLADKELRFLIGNLSKTQAHIVTIFDCCHSGGNTRNGDFDTPAVHSKNTLDIQKRRLSMAFPKRNWEDFIFSDSISQQDFKMKGISTCMPEGEHLQIAACQDDESAYEVGGEGVFTKNLINILQRCGGSISYHRLQSTIQGYLRHQFNQCPKIYSVGDSSVLFSNFLNKNSTESGLKGSISYNSTLGWTLDMGSMQGMVSGIELVLLDQNKRQSYKAVIESVNVTYATIRFLAADASHISEGLIFTTEINSFFTNALHVFIDPSVTEYLEQTSLPDKIKGSGHLSLTEEITLADYCLTAFDESLILSYPGNPKVPLVPKIELGTFGESEGNLVFNYLDHLSRHTFVKYLHNPGAFMVHPNLIDLSVFLSEEGQSTLPISNDTLLLNYEKTDEAWKGSIRIKLRNNSDRKLYCALCYLSLNFGVFTNMLQEGVIGLGPRQEVWAFEGNAIHFKLEPEITTFEYPESISYMKLLISTEDFSQQLSTLALDDLPGPVTAQQGHKGLQIIKKAEVVNDWTSRLITIRMPNPDLED